MIWYKDGPAIGVNLFWVTPLWVQYFADELLCKEDGEVVEHFLDAKVEVQYVYITHR